MMSILSLCSELRQAPFAQLAAECATSLDGFFHGYAHANGAIRAPLARVKHHFPGSEQMSACRRGYLASPDARTSFHRVLDALEHELRTGGEPPPHDDRSGPPLLDAILDSIANHRTGLYLIEPTAGCLFETLNGYACGLDALDPAAAAEARATMQRFDGWLRRDYDPAQAPWHSILRIYGGSLSVLEELAGLFHKLRREDLAAAGR